MPIDRNSQLHNLLDLRRITATRPDNDQVRVQRHQAFDVDTGHVTDARNQLCRWWLIGILDSGYHPSTEPCRKQQLAGPRGKTDDPAGSMRQAPAVPRIVGESDRG